MKKIAIYGAGGFGRETALLIRQINQVTPTWELTGFFDDGLVAGTSVDDVKVLGGVQSFKTSGIPHLVMAIADPSSRNTLVLKIGEGAVFPTLIHPRCELGDSANKFGKGCIFTSGVIMTTHIELGDFVIVNLASTLGHDVKVGDFSIIMPGCSISGNVRIGRSNIIGTGARILQNLTIGDDCRIGAGAVVTQNFGSNKTIVGVPAYEK